MYQHDQPAESRLLCDSALLYHWQVLAGPAHSTHITTSAVQ